MKSTNILKISVLIIITLFSLVKNQEKPKGFIHPKYTTNISTYKEGDKGLELEKKIKEINKNEKYESPAIYTSMTKGDKKLNPSQITSSTANSSSNTSTSESSFQEAKYENPVISNHNGGNNNNSNNNTPSYTNKNSNNNNNNSSSSSNYDNSNNKDETNFVEVKTVKKNNNNNSITNESYNHISKAVEYDQNSYTVKSGITSELKEMTEKAVQDLKKEVASYDKKQDSAMHQDIEVLLAQFENKKDRDDKINVMLKGKERLLSEAGQLKLSIRDDINELMELKKATIRLNNVVNIYTNKIEEDKQKHLNLADEVGLKDLIRQKLHREIQGFRVSPTEFAELEKVNPNDIARISNEIEAKLSEEPLH